MRLFLEGCDEELTAKHPNLWKKGQDIVLLCTFLGLGVMWQVSNMNERLKVVPNTLLKKLFHI